MSQMVYFSLAVCLIITIMSIVFNVYVWKGNVDNKKYKDLTTTLNAKTFAELKKTIDYNTRLIEDNRDKMDDINDDVGKNRANISETNSKLRTQDELLDLSDIKELRNNMEANKKEIDANKTTNNSINNNLRALTERVDVNSNAIFGNDGLQTRFATLQESVETNSNMMSNQDRYVAGLASQVFANYDMLSFPSKHRSGLSTLVHENSNMLFGADGLSNLQSQFATLREDLSGLEDENQSKYALNSYESLDGMERALDSLTNIVEVNSNALHDPSKHRSGLSTIVYHNSNMLFGADGLNNMQSQLATLQESVNSNSNRLSFPREHPSGLSTLAQSSTSGGSFDYEFEMLSTLRTEFDMLSVKVDDNSNMLSGYDIEFDMLRGRVDDNSNVLFGDDGLDNLRSQFAILQDDVNTFRSEDPSGSPPRTSGSSSEENAFNDPITRPAYILEGVHTNAIITSDLTYNLPLYVEATILFNGGSEGIGIQMFESEDQFGLEYRVGDGNPPKKAWVASLGETFFEADNDYVDAGHRNNTPIRIAIWVPDINTDKIIFYIGDTSILTEFHSIVLNNLNSPTEIRLLWRERRPSSTISDVKIQNINPNATSST